MSSEQEEIQKKLEELQRQAEQFQAGGGYQSNNYSSGESSSGFNPQLKLILVVVGVIIVLVASIYFAVKSGNNKSQMKVPPGYKIIYPTDGPPRLELK